MPKRTYVDACVLISAFRGDEPSASAALAVLGDPARVFVVSDYLRLETLPKPTFHKNDAEVTFYSAFFHAARKEREKEEKRRKGRKERKGARVS